MRPVVVFNPHPWPLRGDVELEYTWTRAQGHHVVDDEGASVPMQLTRPLTTMSGMRSRFAFPVEVPPLGYRTYRVRLGAVEGEPLRATDTTLENAHLLLELDQGTGRIARLVLKSTGADLAAPAEGTRSWSTTGPTRGATACGRTTERSGEFECVSVRLLECGPVRAIVRVESRCGSSTLREDYVLGADVPYVDVRVALDWREQLKLLKLRYPTSVDAATRDVRDPVRAPRARRAAATRSRVSRGSTSRATARGLTVINDAKYGYDVRGGDIGISAVRSPVWAWHDPRELEEDGDFEYMDQGRQSFVVRLVPHAARLARRRRPRACAAELNQPPFALIETFHDGPLPQRALVRRRRRRRRRRDRAEACRGRRRARRARLRDGRPRPDARAIELPLVGRTIEADFGAHEIKTFRVPRDPGEPVVETNLLEW